MSDYSYVARTEGGERTSGMVRAATVPDAVALLRDEGLVVERVREAGGRGAPALASRRGRRIRESSLAIASSQLASLLGSGLPAVRALRVVGSQTPDARLSRTLTEAADDVAAGYGLARSLERRGQGLPVTFVEAVRAGEEAGRLDAAFARLATHYRRRSRTRGKVRGAMVYPVVVVAVALAVMVVIMVFAVPVFRSAFASFGVELPLATRAVIAASDFLSAWWWAIVAAVALAAVALRLALRAGAFRLWCARAALRVPVVGRISLMDAAAQYASAVSVALATGLPVVSAVGIAARSLANPSVSLALTAMLPQLDAGRPLSACLRDARVLPDLVTDMTAVGEDAGTLGASMDVVSDYFDNEVELASARALSALEPATILVLAALVLVLLLAVYLPMFNLYGAV